MKTLLLKISTAISILVVSSMALATTEADKVVYKYVVAPDVYGTLRCYHVDRNDVAFGLAVDENLCGKTFLVVPDVYGSNRCFHIDQLGRAYGNPAADKICSAGFKVAPDSSGGLRCFNFDKNGLPYGNAVEDTMCAAPKN